MKAILVIDMPKDCFTCELGGSKVCIGGCPLKPMPNKWYEDGSTSFAMGIARGFNKCIDKITGEKE